MLLTCSLRTCSSCAAKDSCRFAVSAAAPGGNPVWSFSMVSEPFSEEFGSLPPLREGHVGIGTRRPTWLVYWLLARPFFIRDRWRLKEVDHPPPVKVKEKLFFFSSDSRARAALSSYSFLPRQRQRRVRSVLSPSCMRAPALSGGAALFFSPAFLILFLYLYTFFGIKKRRKRKGKGKEKRRKEKEIPPPRVSLPVLSEELFRV
jgi:hypothetical protein